MMKIVPTLLCLSFLTINGGAAALAAKDSASKPTVGVAETRKKIELIRIPEIAYDGLTVDEVVQDLQEQAKVHDPAGLGLKFRIESDAVRAKPGDPFPLGASDARQVLVNIKLPLFNLNLRQVLDMIVRTSDEPMQYEVGANTILFHLAESLPTRKKLPNEHVHPDRTRLLKLVKQVRLREIYYDGLTLDEVIQDVIEQTHRQKAKINFLINSQVHDPEDFVRERWIPMFYGSQNTTPMRMTRFGPVLSPMCSFGAPPPSFSQLTGPLSNLPPQMISCGAPGVDLSQVLITTPHVRHNITLEDTLDLVVKHADQPILYTVEEYGIIFESRRLLNLTTPPTSIKVNSSRVLAKLDALSGDQAPRQRTQLSRRLQSYFFAAGIESMAEHEWRSRVLFVPENNLILVNALEQDLPRIKQVIQRLNSP